MDTNTQISIDELQDLKVRLHMLIMEMEPGTEQTSRAIDDYLKVTRLEHEFVNKDVERRREDDKAEKDRKMKRLEFAIQIGGIVYPISVGTLIHFIDMHWEETKDLLQPARRAMAKFGPALFKIRW